MEYLNKIMSAVSTAKAAVDSVLPGNPVTREYEAISHVASAGPGLSWKIYSGFKKTSRKVATLYTYFIIYNVSYFCLFLMFRKFRYGFSKRKLSIIGQCKEIAILCSKL